MHHGFWWRGVDACLITLFCTPPRLARPSSRPYCSPRSFCSNLIGESKNPTFLYFSEMEGTTRMPTNMRKQTHAIGSLGLCPTCAPGSW